MSSPFVTSEPRTSTSGNIGSSNGHHSGRSQKTIYVSQQQQPQRIDGVLGFLVKVFHLDIYGTSQLTRCVLYELKAIALALGIMFVFDLAAWTFFWNMVLYNGRLAIGFYSLFAVLFALMFALIIVIYERQWVVTDLSRFSLRDWRSAFKISFAFCVRLFVIVLAAYATAQPIEVLFFNGQIQKRVHDESVRHEAITQFRNYQDKLNKMRGATAYTGTQVEKESKDADAQLAEAQRKDGTLREELRRANAEVTAAERRLSGAQNSRNTKNRAARIARAQEQLNRARTNATNAQNALGSNSGLLSGAENKVKLSSEEIKGLEKKADEDRQTIIEWINSVRRSNPGARLEKQISPTEKLVFEDKDYDFFERMTIIDDLYWGRPPKWTGADQTEVNDLKREFAFGESADASRRDVDALSFQKQWIGLLVITFIFPLSVIAMKLLMSVDKSLMNYYSYDMQMENNDYAVHLENRHPPVETDENGNGNGENYRNISID